MKPLTTLTWEARISTVRAHSLMIAMAFVLGLFGASARAAGYLHASGTRILDGGGNAVTLTGSNTESWLLYDPFWTDRVSLSGTWNQAGDTPFVQSITGQIGSTTGDWVKVDDGDPSVTYSAGWNQIANWSGNPGYLNSQHWSATVGASATYAFTGTQAQFYGYKRPDLGIANIYVDGVLKTSVDCYNAIPYYGELLYQIKGLKKGAHTMQIVVSASKNPASSNTQIICDAFTSGTAPTHGVSGIETAWRNNKIQKADIAYMAISGVNSVRVNLDCRLFGAVHTTSNGYQVMDVDTTTPAVGFKYLDNLVSWCNTYHVYAILDLHIFLQGLTDSPQSLASEQALWQAIAARYATSPYVGGYDLWNEPNYNDGGFSLTSNQNSTVVYVHQQLINAIRQVDPNHLIFLEGLEWDDRLDCFFYNPTTGALTNQLQVTDPANNLAFQFHRYGGTLPDAYTIAEDAGPDGSDYSGSSPAYLWTIPHQKKLAGLANLPLWCGEAGYNSNSFLQLQGLLNRRSTDPTDYGVSAGTTFWHYKKDNTGGVYYYPWPSPAAGVGFDLVNTYWDDMTQYWSGNVTTPPTPGFTPQQADTDIYNFCTSVAASNCKSNPQIIGLLNGGLLDNAGFDADGAVTKTPSYWNTWGANPEANYTDTKGGGHTGSWHLTQSDTVNYQVYTYQGVSNLVNGTYTMTAWVKSSGGQSTAQILWKDYDSSGNQMSVNIPASKTWTEVTIPNVQVTSGQSEIGIYSVATAGQYVFVDDVALTVQ